MNHSVEIEFGTRTLNNLRQCLSARKCMTHVHYQVLEHQRNRGNHKGGERNLNPMLHANPYDSLPFTGISVAVDCQSPIGTGPTATGGRRRLNQWSSILFDGEAYDELLRKDVQSVRQTLNTWYAESSQEDGTLLVFRQ